MFAYLLKYQCLVILSAATFLIADSEISVVYILHKKKNYGININRYIQSYMSQTKINQDKPRFWEIF